MPNTSYLYHVLMNISTRPVIVPIEDYCRAHSCSREEIETKWESFEQEKPEKCQESSVRIKVYYNQKEWSVGESSLHHLP